MTDNAKPCSWCHPGPITEAAPSITHTHSLRLSQGFLLDTLLLKRPSSKLPLDSCNYLWGEVNEFVINEMKDK